MSWFDRLKLIANRRKTSRVDLSQVRYAVAFQYGDHVSTGWLIDINAQGAQFCLHENCQPYLADNQDYSLRIKTFDDNESFIAKISLIWERYDDANEMTFLGCQFPTLDAKQTKILGGILAVQC